MWGGASSWQVAVAEVYLALGSERGGGGGGPGRGSPHSRAGGGGGGGGGGGVPVSGSLSIDCRVVYNENARTSAAQPKAK